MNFFKDTLNFDKNYFSFWSLKWWNLKFYSQFLMYFPTSWSHLVEWIIPCAFVFLHGVWPSHFWFFYVLVVFIEHLALLIPICSWTAIVYTRLLLEIVDMCHLFQSLLLWLTLWAFLAFLFHLAIPLATHVQQRLHWIVAMIHLLLLLRWIKRSWLQCFLHALNWSILMFWVLLIRGVVVQCSIAVIGILWVALVLIVGGQLQTGQEWRWTTDFLVEI